MSTRYNNPLMSFPDQEAKRPPTKGVWEQSPIECLNL